MTPTKQSDTAATPDTHPKAPDNHKLKPGEWCRCTGSTDGSAQPPWVVLLGPGSALPLVFPATEKANGTAAGVRSFFQTATEDPVL